MGQAKYRHELKYVVTTAQIAILKARISGLLPQDSHANSSGCYNISSLYFDDYYNHYFFENENGTEPREKFRIRIYNHSANRITLELKRKEHGKTLKQAVPLTPEQTRLLMTGQIIPDIEKQHTLLKKLTVEMKQQLLHPVVIVEYDRYPYIYRNGNVRITFDTNISSTTTTKDFFRAQYPKRPVMPVGLHLMEVKYDEYLPDFIYSTLQLDNLQQTAYSKYYFCRKYSLK